MNATSNNNACPIADADLQKMGLTQETFAALHQDIRNILNAFFLLDDRRRERFYGMLLGMSMESLLGAKPAAQA